jgi:hypothetical protein
MEEITKQDLMQLKADLIRELQEMIQKHIAKPEEPALWVRSSVVKKKLGISSATLLNLRVRAVLKPRKIGGSYFYNLREVDGLFTKK